MPESGAASITDVSVQLPALHEVIQVLTFQAGFNSTVVVLSTTLLGVAAGLVGTFALLRKRALMGDALAHSALPGLALAYIIAVMLGFEGKELSVLLLGATLSGVLGVVCVQFLTRNTRLAEDTAIGVVLSVFFGAGVVLLSVIQSLGTGTAGGLHHFIYGQTAAMNRADTYITMGAVVLALMSISMLFKEFRLVCFDSPFARVQGWPVNLIDFIMMSLVVLVTVIGLQAVGMILIIALLIVPPAAARFWTERLTVMAWLAAIIGGLSGYLGATFSSLLPRLPTGSVIVLTAGFLFFVSFFLAPSRGVIGTAFRRFKLRLRVAGEHFLRGVYETSERQGRVSGELFTFQPLYPADVPIVRGWPALFRWIVLSRAKLQRLIELLPDGRFVLTPEGGALARQLTRNHRLWEAYMLNYTRLTDSHVDLSADIAEHVLTPAIVAKLEAALRSANLLPVEGGELVSVHPLEGADA